MGSSTSIHICRRGCVQFCRRSLRCAAVSADPPGVNRLGLLSLPLLASTVIGTAAALASAHLSHAPLGARHRRGHAHSSSFEHELRASDPASHRRHGRSHRTARKATPAGSKQPHAATSSGQLPAHRAQLEASVAKVLATPCQNAQLGPEAGNLSLIRAAVLCLVNKVRAQHGEAPLQSQPNLERAGEAHAQEMIAVDYFEHVSPSGLTPVGRAREDGYISDPGAGYVIGENLAWGTLNLATPEAIVAAWVASPGHLANILEAEYRDTGIGVAPQVPSSLSGGEPGATYAQEFGVIVH